MVKKCHLCSIELLVVLFVSGTGHPALVEAGVVSGESLAAAVTPHPVHALQQDLYQASGLCHADSIVFDAF
jgi:hypothetical protein